MKYSTVNFIVALGSLLLTITGYTQQMGDNVAGLYWSPNKNAKIEIYKSAGKFYGKSTWVAVPGKDDKNPDKTLRERPVLGLELLKDFRYKDGAYEQGTIYDPETGKTYDCKMSLAGNRLKVRGFIGISLFGRTEIFERIN